MGLLLHMKIEELIRLFGKQPCFDLASVVQLCGGCRETVRTELYRWCKAGKILHLRRGMYAFGSDYRKTEVNPAELANLLYFPAYLSSAWALGFFGLIPEKVVVYTSITSREPKTFRNAFGHFRYRHIKKEAFFGYRAVEISRRKVLLAEPEKALLDFWYFEKGEWDKNRLAEMRLQNLDLLAREKLLEYAARFKSPKLTRAVELYSEMHRTPEEGGVEL
jgi:predicted transcriptional regulator of viral defense system